MIDQNKTLQNMRFYVSNEDIWWNKGTELKPTNRALLSILFTTIDFDKNTISWVDENHIRVIVPNSLVYRIIKIEFWDVGDMGAQNNIREHYYYLSEIRNKTKFNSECIFEMDLWCSYVLANRNFNSNTLRNTRTLNINDVNKFYNIEPVGSPTGTLNKSSAKINYNENFYFKSSGRQLANFGKCYEWIKKDDTTVNSNIEDDYQNISIGAESNIYFVFKGITNINSKNNKTSSEQDTYILIPVLNIDRFGLYTVLPLYSTTRKAPDIYNFNTYDKVGVGRFLNNYDTIMRAIEIKDNNQHMGLGDFLGCWVGPSYYRLKDFPKNNINQKIRVEDGDYELTKFDAVIETPYIVFSNDITNNLEKEKWDFVLNNDAHNKAHREIKNEILNNKNKYAGIRYKNLTGAVDINKLTVSDINFGVLVSLRVGANFFKLSNIDHPKNKWVKNINYLGNPNNFLTTPETKCFFNQKFTFTNGKDNTDIDIQVPVAFDNYQNLLSAQKNTMNTGLWVSGVNTAIQTAKSAVGVGASVATGNVAGAISGVVGALSGPLQFINTLKQQQAYKDDLRTRTSNTITNMTDLYMQWFSNLQDRIPKVDYKLLQQVDNLSVFLDLLAFELCYGYETLTLRVDKFYGYETIPYLLNANQNWKNEENYIKLDEPSILELKLTLANDLSPTIIDGLATMLSNGVRVSNDRSIKEILDNE